MKQSDLLFVAAWLIITISANGAATVRLNNYDSMLPILYWESGSAPILAPKDRTYVAVTFVIGDVIPIGATSPVIRLSEDGYFDAGYGILPNRRDGIITDCSLLVWMDTPNFVSATNRSQVIIWHQPTGSWDATANPAVDPTGPALALTDSCSSQFGIPGAAIITIPEPHTWTLMVIGLSALVWKRARS